MKVQSFKMIFFFYLVLALCGMERGAAFVDQESHLSLEKCAQCQFLDGSIRKKIKPYLLPPSHPTKKILDSLFLNQRPTRNSETLAAAGFKTLYVKPRSYVRVVKHPLLEGYLMKIYLDSEERKKQGKPGWEWLVNRCRGADRVRNAIKKVRSEYYQVPGKWLYLLSPDSSPSAKGHEQQPVILIVEDMNICSERESKFAWRTQIRKKHLRELHSIITLAGGSSYRPDNICLSKNGKFSFIDTEYPHTHSDYGTIRPYLSEEMKVYWDTLTVK